MTVEWIDPFEDGLLQIYDLSGSELIVPLPIHDTTPRISPPAIDIHNPEHLPIGSPEGYRIVELLGTNWNYDYKDRVLHRGYKDPGGMYLDIDLTHDVEPFFAGNLLNESVLRACVMKRWQLQESKSLEREARTAEFMGEPAPTGPIFHFPVSDEQFGQLRVGEIEYQRVVAGSPDMDFFTIDYFLSISPEHYLKFRFSPSGFLTERDPRFGTTKEERQTFVNNIADDVMRQIRFTPSDELKAQMAELEAA